MGGRIFCFTALHDGVTPPLRPPSTERALKSLNDTAIISLKHSINVFLQEDNFKQSVTVFLRLASMTRV